MLPRARRRDSTWFYVEGLAAELKAEHIAIEGDGSWKIANRHRLTKFGSACFGRPTQ